MEHRVPDALGDERQIDQVVGVQVLGKEYKDIVYQQPGESRFDAFAASWEDRYQLLDRTPALSRSGRLRKMISESRDEASACTIRAFVPFLDHGDSIFVKDVRSADYCHKLVFVCLRGKHDCRLQAKAVTPERFKGGLYVEAELWAI